MVARLGAKRREKEFKRREGPDGVGVKLINYS